MSVSLAKRFTKALPDSLKLINCMNEKEILLKLTALCSGAEHCSYEMLEKMRKWGVDDATQAKVMAYLTAEKYVDDERYCRLFVREKIRFNKWGRRKVEQALYMKRIPADISGPILDEVPDEDYLQVLRPLLRSKEKTVKANSEYEKNMKLIKFAMGKGFTFNIIKQCLSGDMDDVDDAE